MVRRDSCFTLENINWHQRYIMVEKSFRNSRVTDTKTGRVRRVDMSSQLVTVLKDLLKKRKIEALESGAGEIVPIIFHMNVGHTSQDSVRNVWKRVLSKAGLDYRKFHTVRHTVASILIAEGKSLAYIKEMSGHSSIQATVGVYGHLLPSSDREAINSLDDDATDRNLSATTENTKAVTR